MHAQSMKILALTFLLLAGSAGAANKKSHAKPAKTGSDTSATARRSALSKKSLKRKAARPRAQMAPTPQRIQEIQSALAGKGAYQGDPNGKWDAPTVDAMKQFQTANGLNPSGKLDALTLEKLGLGSSTAGRGAPPHEPSPTAKLVSPPPEAQDK